MTDLPPLKTGPWRITDLGAVKKHGHTVFSCFHCGGGSSFGYKLAGYDVLGGVEIDPKMMEIYRANHHPKHSYLMGVQDFIKLDDATLPPILFDLDVLDGSPPCSSFSMAGSREKAWGEKKKFREGQAMQVLDDLFFDFIAVAKKLRPKVVVAENVKGMLQGNARGYVKEIFTAFKAAGYETQLFLLNASRMGVPQARERVFFIANRLGKRINLEFNEPIISVGQAFADLGPQQGRAMSTKTARFWANTDAGRLFSLMGADTGKVNRRLHLHRPAWTQKATPSLYHWNEPRHLSRDETIRVQSFPDDYNFCGQDPIYVCGMSVPPFMMQRVSREIVGQLLG